MADTGYIVNKGLELIVSRLKGVGNEPKYMHWGTGSTAANAADTALETPVSEARVDGASSIVTTSTSNDTYQVVGTLVVAGAAKAIKEVALFDASTAGNMLFHGTFDVINLGIGDSLEMTVQVVADQA